MATELLSDVLRITATFSDDLYSLDSIFTIKLTAYRTKGHKQTAAVK